MQIDEGKALMDKQDYWGALRIFVTVLDEAEASTPVLILKANCLLAVNEYEKAMKLARHVLLSVLCILCMMELFH